jgi:hypothetical protein
MVGLERGREIASLTAYWLSIDNLHADNLDFNFVALLTTYTLTLLHQGVEGAECWMQEDIAGWEMGTTWGP